MPTTIENYMNIKERALELGCNIPSGLSFLPRNFDSAKSKSELIYESTVSDIRILFRDAEIAETKLEKQGDKFSYKQDKHFDWIGPTIFIGASILSQNPYIISITVGIISNYLTDLFKGSFYSKNIKLSYVVEKISDKEIKRFSYEGDVTGLHNLPQIIHEALKNE
jgi:hypothetical protein